MMGDRYHFSNFSEYGIKGNYNILCNFPYFLLSQKTSFIPVIKSNLNGGLPAGCYSTEARFNL